MSITFDSVAANIRIPLVTAEFTSSKSSQGPALLNYRALIVGQKTAEGSGVANTFYRISRKDDARVIGGPGSQLHRQAIAWYASNQGTELWLGVLADHAAGVDAAGTTTITGTATSGGPLPIYIGGNLVVVGVTVGDTPTAIAAAVTAACALLPDLPVTVTSLAGVITYTAKNAGLVGNGIDIRHKYLDTDTLPAGVSLVHAQMAAGATNPLLADLIAAMGDAWYQIICHPYTDAASLTAIENLLALRFGPTKMIDGVAITSAKGTYAELSAIGEARNSQHSVIVGQPGKNPITPPNEFAAGIAAQAAKEAAKDPARPLQTLVIQHAMPVAEVDKFIDEERNNLLFSGIAVTSQDEAGAVRIGRLITTYRKNAAGADDESYLDVSTLLTLLYLRHSWRVRMMTKYPRHKLANDGTQFAAGQSVMTPLLGAAEALGWFREMEALGLVENYEQFADALVVVRNIVDPNRLDLLIPPDLINQLIVVAAKFEFRR